MRRAFVRSVVGLAVAVAGGGLVTAKLTSAQSRPIAIGYQETPDWLLFVARDRRLFERAGLAATFVKFNAGPPMIDAARNGSINLASIDSVAFLMGLLQGVDSTMIGINPGGRLQQSAFSWARPRSPASC